MVESIQDLLRRPGTDKESAHSYGAIYDDLFGAIRDTSAPILEIGIRGGGSLRAWADAFKNARVYGIDINPDTMIADHPRISTHCIDVRDHDAVTRFAIQYGPFGVVIDDGSHKIGDIMRAFSSLRPHVVSGGLYVVEDVQSEINLACLLTIARSRYIDLRKVKQRSDDLVVVIEL